MPRKGNRKRRHFRAQPSDETVTVAFFANSDPAMVRSGRMKKAFVNAFQKEAEQFCGLAASSLPMNGGDKLRLFDGRNYDLDKEDEGFEDDEEFSLESGECEGQDRTRNKKKSKKNPVEEIKGMAFPLDMWLTLSAYIRPEDVNNFALICKDAWIVTCTAAFWTRMYRRYYHMGTTLPLRLKLESIKHSRYLKAGVVCSLFHLYEPFRRRALDASMLPDGTVASLQNAKCLLSWYTTTISKNQDKMWEFNFKFKMQCLRGKGRSQRCLLTHPVQYREVNKNPEQDCCVLRLTTPSYSFMPALMGMTLAQISLSISSDMRHEHAKLLFQDAPAQPGRRVRSAPANLVVLDPVLSVRVLHWWHPQYPCL
uniref:transmembrane protein 183A isoform X2 n=1 Tax=Myxine glutinosa TaxID=7769 RepID=UPI00358EA85E